MLPCAIVGGTGLTGSAILGTLLTHPRPTTVSAFTRSELRPTDPHSRLRPLTNSDTTAWAGDFSSIRPAPRIFFSALGTTRGRAGGLEAQRRIDYDLNLELAKAAHDAGVPIYVLISSSGASSTSMFPYMKMKGELNDAVTKIGFEKTIILKPGLLLGSRRSSDSRPAEYLMQCIANVLGKISNGLLRDGWAQDIDVIARAAVAASLMTLDGTAPDGPTWVLHGTDIIRLGRTEWKNE